MFWSRSQTLVDVGAGAKILDARSQSLKFEYWLHRPEKSTECQRMSKLFTKQPMNSQKSRFKSLDTTYTVKQFLKNCRHIRKSSC